MFGIVAVVLGSAVGLFAFDSAMLVVVAVGLTSEFE
jgi:hypothetical protein